MHNYCGRELYFTFDYGFLAYQLINVIWNFGCLHLYAMKIICYMLIQRKQSDNPSDLHVCGPQLLTVGYLLRTVYL